MSSKIPKLCYMHVNDLNLNAGKQYGRKKSDIIRVTSANCHINWLLAIRKGNWLK